MSSSRAQAEATPPPRGPASPPSIAPGPFALPWQQLIHRTRTRINCGWLADALGPLFLMAGMAACVLLLILRSLNHGPSAGPCALAGGLLLLLLPVIAYWRARRRFVSLDEVCVRLEAHLKLHNALSAARCGVRPWPPLPPAPDSRLASGLSWNWPHLALPPLLAAGLIALPFALPAPLPAPSQLPPNQPLAWETMEQWLEELSEKEIADPERIREFEKVLENLRQTPAGQWFGNSSLEATDALQSTLERSVHELESQLSRSAQALSLLEAPSGQLSTADRQALQSQLQQALEGLSRQELPLHPSRLEQLRQCNPSSLGNDPAASRALCDALRQNAKSLRDLMSQSDALRQQWENQLKADALLGKIASEAPETEPGLGTPSRGPGEAPLHYKDEPVDLKTQAPEELSNLDPSHAAPGDLLGIDAAKPSIEQSPGPANQSAGALSSSGKGGHEVWESTLLPAERAVLRQYLR